MSLKAQSLGSAGSAAALITISTTTNATPIVATFAADHGLKSGDRIAVAGVTGNTNANGEWEVMFTGTNTAQFLGSAGNGTHGGTVRVGLLMDRTPFMQKHNNVLHTFGNLVGTVDFEAYGSYDDFASGFNTAGASAPVRTNSGVTNSAGSASTPAKSTLTAAVTNAGFIGEVTMPRILRAVITAYTSGTMHARVTG